MKEVITKLCGVNAACEKIENSLKANKFSVPGELITHREELTFVVKFIVNDKYIWQDSLAEYLKSMKDIFVEYEDRQDAFTKTQCYDAVRRDMQIKERRRVLKILEITFPDEVKAVEVHPTVDVITPQAMTAWLQSKPPAKDIEAVLNVIRACTPDDYEFALTINKH
jgi:hypothetical protein